MRLTTSLACVIVSSLSTALASAATPTSPETKAEMIKLIDSLEKKPYDPDTRDTAGTVMTWLQDAPDVSVNLCLPLLGDLDELEKDGGDILSTQLPFAEARFILENPSRAEDAQAVHVAGVEGVLRTYAAMKAAKPDLRIRQMEKLVKMQADKKIDAFVKDAIKICH
jgi:hypothetical protein